MKRFPTHAVTVLVALAMIAATAPALAGASDDRASHPGVYPADFALALELQAARRFTANDIKSFVHHVFSMYERATSESRRIGPEAFRPLIDDNVRIDFPDYKIANWTEFVAWHKWIHDQLIGDDHVIESIDVEFLSDGRYQAHFVVNWRALFRSGQYTDVRVEQTWTMREQADRDLPVIETYVAKLAEFPGAR
jgi:hypothetical protein